MDQNSTATNQVTFVDILKMFKGKLKVIICVAIIAAIIGAAAGAVIAMLGKSYGGNITFYIVPGEDTPALLDLLRSESFSEKLLLDENGLPPKAECDPEEYDAALKAIQAEEAARLIKYELNREVNLYPYSLTIIEKNYINLKDEYTRISTLLDTYKRAPSDTVTSQESHLKMIEELEIDLKEAQDALSKYKTETYDPAVAKKLELDEQFYIAKRNLGDARLLSDELVEKVVSKWREKEEVKELVAEIQKSVTYEYSKIVDSATAADNSENQNNSFLVVSIAVERDLETAERIMDMIKTRTPEYVEKNIERLTGVTDARCTLTSTHIEPYDVNESSLVKNIVLYTVIAAILGVILAVIVIIVKGIIPAELTEKKSKKTKKATENVQ